MESETKKPETQEPTPQKPEDDDGPCFAFDTDGAGYDSGGFTTNVGKEKSDE